MTFTKKRPQAKLKYSHHPVRKELPSMQITAHVFPQKRASVLVFMSQETSGIGEDQ